MTGLIYPNDYTLVTLTLLTSTITFDVKNIFMELSYNEDLFNNTASGYIMVVDSTGFIESLQMNGTEFIRMTFGKGSNQTNLIDKLFRIFKVSKRTTQNNTSTETYALYFCSEDLLLSEQYKVAKAYTNQGITSIISDILTTYLKVDDSNINDLEQTYGVYNFIVPNLKPFDAINWLCTYARPGVDNLGADMIFYEDKNGYNLNSLQTLMMQDAYQTYSFNPKNLASTEQTLANDISNVITYEILDSYDSLGAINSWRIK